MAPRLRDVSARRRPGWYQEDDGPVNADRPIFVHQDVPFNKELAAQCAFPSLPANHVGPGPSEVWKQEQARAKEAAKKPEVQVEDFAIEQAVENDGSDVEDNHENSLLNEYDDFDVDQGYNGEEIDNEEESDDQYSYLDEQFDDYSDLDDSDTESCACSCCAPLCSRGPFESRLFLKVIEAEEVDDNGDETMQGDDSNRVGRYRVSIVRRPRSPEMSPPGQNGAPLPPLEVLRQAYVAQMARSQSGYRRQAKPSETRYEVEGDVLDPNPFADEPDIAEDGALELIDVSHSPKETPH